MMTRNLLFAWLCLVCQIFVYPLSAQNLEVFVDKPLQAYAPGETITFKVRSDLRGALSYRIRYGARTPVLAEATVQYNGGVFEVPFSTNQPSYVNFEVTIAGQGRGISVTIGRDQIKALHEEPADFDAFWASQKAQLAQVPMDVQIYVQEDRQLSTVYQFSAAQIDQRRVYGYIVVPKGAGPFPATLRLPPFGRGPNSAQPDVFTAETANCIAASITIHNAPANQEDPRAYEPEDLRNRETIYYRYAILAAIRAIDVLNTRDEWNRSQLLIYGDSQGGGLAMLVAGIDGRPTHLAQSVGALSQHSAEVFGLASGYPYFYEVGEDRYPESKSDLDRVMEAVKYYDAAFAVRRFKGPSVHFNNYLDPVCTPASHYAAFNELTGPKVVLHSLDMYHNNADEWTTGLHDFTRTYFPKAGEPPFIYGSKKHGHLIDAGVSPTVNVQERLQLQPSLSFNSQSPDSDWTYEWEKLSGPGEVDFENVTALNTGVKFSAAGQYTLQLRAIDPYPEEPRKYWLLADRMVVNVSGNPTSTTTLPTLKKIEVYPNPTAGLLTLDAEFETDQEVALRLSNQLGQVVQVFGVETTSMKVLRKQLDLHGLVPGVYHLSLSTSSGQQHFPILLQSNH